MPLILRLITAALLASQRVLVAFGAQKVLDAKASNQFDGYVDLPKTMYLSNMKSHEFTTLSHPRFPNHQVRLKKSHFCDPTVKYVIILHLC